MHSSRWWSVFSNWPTYTLLIVWTGWTATPARAVVNTEVTRVIFNAGESHYSLALANSAQHPALVQIWTDEGDPLSQPAETITPIVAIPPVFKMQPTEIRTVKLQLAEKPGLARERESLYWLNIYQIPPMTDQDAKTRQKLVLPLRIRMKVFIRPQGVGPLREQDGERLTFTFQPQEAQLYVNNPTPWYITLAALACDNTSSTPLMIAPLSSQPLALPGKVGHCRTVRYELINDHGNRWVYEKPIINSGAPEKTVGRNPRR